MPDVQLQNLPTEATPADAHVVAGDNGTVTSKFLLSALKAYFAASPALTGTPTAPTAAPGTNTTQLATTAFAAAIAALKADLNSPTFTGTPAAPTPSAGDNTTRLATTAYVVAALASLAANLGKRGRVRAATTANVTIATALNNGDTLDGVSLVTGDWVLVKNQSSAAENGVYEVGVSPARVSEFDAYDEYPGALIAVQEGTTNADTLWLCTSNVGGTIGVTAINFSQFSASGALLAANNLSDLSNAATARTNLGLSALATATTSAAVRSAISDEDGDGALLFANASVTLTGATNLVRATHGNRLLICNSASPFTLTIEDDATGGWGDSDGFAVINIGAGTVTIAGDGTSTVTAVPGYALTIPQGGVGAGQRSGANAWGAYGQLAVQAQATWEAGVGTQESVISPAKLAAAIAALAAGGATTPTQHEWYAFVAHNGTVWTGNGGLATIQGTVASVTTPFDTSYGSPRGRMTASDAVVNSGVATARGIGVQVGGYMPGSVDSQRVIYEGLLMPTDTATGRRWAAGLYLNNSGNPAVGADPDAWTNVAIFAKRASDSNVQFITNDGSGTGTATDLGANFPAAASDAIYFVRVTARGGATPAIDYFIKHLKTGDQSTGSITADIPAAGSLLAYIMWTSNGPTTATAATLDASWQRLRLQYQGVAE